MFPKLVEVYLQEVGETLGVDPVDCLECAFLSASSPVLQGGVVVSDLARGFVHAWASGDLSGLPEGLAAQVRAYRARLVSGDSCIL